MDYIQRLRIIAENVRKSKSVNSFDTNLEREADTISHALLDMQESFKIIEDLICKLHSKDISGEDIDSILLEIGEELRHIMYHIQDTRFYNYLNADKQ